MLVGVLLFFLSLTNSASFTSHFQQSIYSEGMCQLYSGVLPADYLNYQASCRVLVSYVSYLNTLVPIRIRFNIAIDTALSGCILLRPHTHRSK